MLSHSLERVYLKFNEPDSARLLNNVGKRLVYDLFYHLFFYFTRCKKAERVSV